MKDEWLRAAMADDKMVAELLLRLKQSDPHPSAFTRQVGAAVAALLASLPPFDWGNHKPRSKAATTASVSAGKKDCERTRRSPTTPLSWSGCGASPSDGYEDSSRLSDRFVPAVRSKGAAANDTTTSTTATKRPRRKKTFAELKDEESDLMKERTHLKRELDTLRIKLDEQRSLNEKLKRIKLEFHVQEQKNDCQMEASTSNNAQWNLLKQGKSEQISDSHNMCPTQTETLTEQAGFVLPDLNMMPEEDCVPGKPVVMS